MAYITNTQINGIEYKLGNSGVASTPSKATGGDSSRDNELILKQNTVYCRSFISGSNGNIVNFRASWYEHTDKN